MNWKTLFSHPEVKYPLAIALALAVSGLQLVAGNQGPSFLFLYLLVPILVRFHLGSPAFQVNQILIMAGFVYVFFTVPLWRGEFFMALAWFTTIAIIPVVVADQLSRQAIAQNVARSGP